MGGCVSSAPVLDDPTGDQAAFAARFEEDRVLGEGAFGQVRLVVEKQQPKQQGGAEGAAPKPQSYACKALRKGVVFKDNVLYPPIPPEHFRAEISMLQTLKGERYCMRLVAVYETPKDLLMITDCYYGGELTEYVAKQPTDLRTEDISRISFQLLSAVDHCAQHNILHRDIKPENVLFESEAPDATLRLIDFGLGSQKVVAKGEWHTTFRGTPFYCSPEMFQLEYSQRTDVWSAGVLLYVLVAGYPAGSLQKAFDKLLDTTRTSAKELIHIPDDLPDSYYELLDALLTCQHTQRTSAAEALAMDFVVFHQDVRDEHPSCQKRAARLQRTPSIVVRGSSLRHSTLLDFQVFERKITACVASMLTATQRGLLWSMLQERGGGESGDSPQLQVVPVGVLKQILKDELEKTECVEIIEGMEYGAMYDDYAYHTVLLQPFVPNEPRGKQKYGSSSNEANNNGTAGFQKKQRMRSVFVRRRSSTTTASRSTKRSKSFASSTKRSTSFSQSLSQSFVTFR